MVGVDYFLRIYGEVCACRCCSNLADNLQGIGRSGSNPLGYDEGEFACSVCGVHIPIGNLACPFCSGLRMHEVDLALLGTEELSRYGDLCSGQSVIRTKGVRFRRLHDKGIGDGH